MCLALCNFKSWKGNREEQKGRGNKTSRKNLLHQDLYAENTQLSGTRKKLAVSLNTSRFPYGSWLKGWYGTTGTTLHPVGASSQRRGEPPWQLRMLRSTGSSAKKAIRHGTCVLLSWVHLKGHRFKPGYADKLPALPVLPALQLPGVWCIKSV